MSYRPSSHPRGQRHPPLCSLKLNTSNPQMAAFHLPPRLLLSPRVTFFSFYTSLHLACLYSRPSAEEKERGGPRGSFYISHLFLFSFKCFSFVLSCSRSPKTPAPCACVDRPTLCNAAKGIASRFSFAFLSALCMRLHMACLSPLVKVCWKAEETIIKSIENHSFIIIDIFLYKAIDQEHKGWISKIRISSI